MPPPLAAEAKPFEDFHFPRRAVLYFGEVSAELCQMWILYVYV